MQPTLRCAQGPRLSFASLTTLGRTAALGAPPLIATHPALRAGAQPLGSVNHHLPQDRPIAALELRGADEVGEGPPAAAAEEDNHGADDALGLYLRQMGAIPLLNRQQELALAERLELHRRRYRHAALANWRTRDESRFPCSETGRDFGCL